MIVSDQARALDGKRKRGPVAARRRGRTDSARSGVRGYSSRLAIEKMQPQVIQETSVNGRRAVWTVGPYPLRLRNGELDFTRLIEGYVLIWTEGKVTYRLETNQSLEDAVKTAESLEPVP